MAWTKTVLKSSFEIILLILISCITFIMVVYAEINVA
jgi:hypothetical protein